MNRPGSRQSKGRRRLNHSPRNPYPVSVSSFVPPLCFFVAIAIPLRPHLRRAGNSLPSTYRIPPTLLLSFLLSLLSLAFGGCAPSGGDRPAPLDREAPPAPAEIDAAILRDRAFVEAPGLAARVARGELPPVSDRLPESPLVVRPMESIGRYGGALRRAMTDEYTGKGAITKTLNENLMGFSRPVADRIERNLAESYEFSEDGRSAVFRLRKGVRWSDGAPFTVDDILFWYYDITFNPNAASLHFPPTEWLIEGEPMKIEKIDDLTLKFSARQPMGRLLVNLCHDDIVVPRHYFQAYHPRYNREASYEDFKARTTQIKLAMDPGVPTVSAWRSVNWVRGRKVEYERNPFYWKVDTAGNQLPYVDRLSFTVIGVPEIMLLKFTNGEIDLFGQYSQITFAQTLRAAEPKGFFKLHTRRPSPGPGVFLNWDTPREDLRRAVRTLPVRVALSHAINREEINEVAFHGLMLPGGYATVPGSPYFSEEDFMRYTAFDPELSRRLLGEAGYRDRDGDGYREFPGSGRRFEITLDVTLGDGFGDAAELVVEYWKAVGVHVHLNPGTSEIIFPRRMNGEFESYILTIPSVIDPLEAPHHWAAVRPNMPYWHRNAASDGPPWFHRAEALIRRAIVSIDPGEVTRLLLEAQRIHSENVPLIGIGAVRELWGANLRVGNVPGDGTFANIYRGWSRPVFHEQLFFRE